MAQETYQKVPTSLRHWQCTSCDLFNPLFDTRCMACFRLQEFNDKSKDHLIELCKTFINQSLSSWHTLPSNAFTIEPLTQALSNKLYKIEVKTSHCDQLRFKRGVLRIFNHRIGLTLDQLSSVYKCFATSGLGAGMLGTFDIGQIEEFIDGHGLNDDKLMHNPELSTNVADILSKIHRLRPVSFNPKQNAMVTKLCANIKVVASIFDRQVERLSNVQKWDFVLQHTTRHSTLNGPMFAELMTHELHGLVQNIERNGDSMCSDLIFSHNDYHSGNMILQNNDESDEMQTEDIKADSDAEGMVVKVIDYEYAGYNYRSFDFGNFFNELMIDNYYKDAPYFKIDEANYPSEDYRRRFVSSYLDALVDETVVNDDTVSSMMKEIEYGSMLSHLWWTMWGIVESQRNDIDWDYMEYARQRLSHFFRVKRTVEGECKEIKTQSLSLIF
eukprot:179839_1